MNCLGDSNLMES